MIICYFVVTCCVVAQHRLEWQKKTVDIKEGEKMLQIEHNGTGKTMHPVVMCITSVTACAKHNRSLDKKNAPTKAYCMQCLLTVRRTKMARKVGAPTNGTRRNSRTLVLKLANLSKDKHRTGSDSTRPSSQNIRRNETPPPNTIKMARYKHTKRAYNTQYSKQGLRRYTIS